MPTYRLITIGPSHYCEKARWALTRSRIPFVEEPHLPLLHLRATLSSGARRTVPVLRTDTAVYPDSSDILELCDRQSSGALFGSGEERRLSLELEDHFDEKLGPHSRRLAYFHVLDDRRLLTGEFASGVSKAERTAFIAMLPAIRSAMRRGMKIDPEGAARSRERCQEIFREVAERLRDGRPYLTGRRFTAADLTFAALAAPLVLPPQYGFPMPPFAEIPAAMQSEVRHFRDTPAGEFVLRIYEKERNNVPPIGE